MLIIILTFVLNNLQTIIPLIIAIISIYQNYKQNKSLNDKNIQEDVKKAVVYAETLFEAGNGPKKLDVVKRIVTAKYPVLKNIDLEATINQVVELYNIFKPKQIEIAPAPPNDTTKIWVDTSESTIQR